MALLVNIFFPVGMATSARGGGHWRSRRCRPSCSSCWALAGAVVLVETANAKLRLFRVPDLLSAAFILAALGAAIRFLFFNDTESCLSLNFRLAVDHVAEPPGCWSFNC